MRVNVELDKEDVLLAVLKDELYGGSFEGMLKDLKARLEGKPYIHKLAERIKADISRIGRLKELDRTGELRGAVEAFRAREKAAETKK